MKKVLIVAYYFGTRIPGLVKYLPEFGWEPILLTISLRHDERPHHDIRVIETPYRDALASLKKLFGYDLNKDIKEQIKERFGVASSKLLVEFILTRIGEIVNYPDGDRGWKPFAVEAGDKLLQKNGIDAIISSSSPVTSHLVAKELKNRYGIPWVADFRDLWSQNHNYAYSPLRRALDRRLELKTVSAADALVTVSQPWADKLSMLHKGKLTYAINNGFDPETVNVSSEKVTDKFTITYTGNIYARKHDPVKLFVALSHLISDGVVDPNNIEVRFYGMVAGWLEKEIEQYGLSSIVNLYGRVPKDVALQKQRESQLLFITKWKDPQDRGAYSGKIFEYLAAKRPILAIDGTDDVVKQLLDETKAGIDAQTIQDIKDALQKLYQNYKLRGEIAYNGIDSEINKYNHREMTQKFSEVLGRLIPE
ncbi:glycosyltransferase [Chloroflexota bacterium]